MKTNDEGREAAFAPLRGIGRARIKAAFDELGARMLAPRDTPVQTRLSDDAVALLWLLLYLVAPDDGSELTAPA